MGVTPDNLRPASFRGVPFHVEAPITLRVGRRVSRTEFPYANKGVTVDMGRRMRDAPIRAFLVGDNLEARRDALLAAVEQEGPGTLVHPTLGAIRVAVADAVELSEAAGVVTLTIPFVEHGDLTFVSSASALTPAANEATAALQAQSADRFAAAFDVAGKPGRTIRAAMDAVSEKINAAEDAARQVCSAASVRTLTASLSNLATSTRSAVKAPADLAAEWQAALVGLVGGLTEFAGIMGDASAVSAAAAAVAGLTTDEQDRRTNTAAQDRLVYTTALALAADEVLGTEWTSYDEAMVAASALSDEYVLAMRSAVSADEYAAIADARAAMVEAVAVEVVDLPRLTTYTPTGPMSALELAQELYGDGRRAQEIVDRNRIAHPGFLTVGDPLQVAAW